MTLLLDRDSEQSIVYLVKWIWLTNDAGLRSKWLFFFEVKGWFFTHPLEIASFLMITQKRAHFFFTRYCTVKKVPSCLVLLRYFWMLKQSNYHLSIRKLVFVSRYKYSLFWHFLGLTRYCVIALPFSLSCRRSDRRKKNWTCPPLESWAGFLPLTLVCRPNQTIFSQ